MGDGTNLNEVMVSRQRVVAPPDRFIAVDDTTLIQALHGLGGGSSNDEILALHELIQGIITHDLLKIRRKIEHNLGAFGTTSHEAGKVPDPVESEFLELDDLEQEKLDDLVSIIKACRYTILNKSEWEAANSEDFLVGPIYLLVSGMCLDGALIAITAINDIDINRQPAHRKKHSEERAQLGDEYADRALIFHRGIKVAHMEGYFYDLKIDALLSFYILQPLWALLVRIATLLDMQRFLRRAPPGMEKTPEDLAPFAASSTAAVDDDIKKGRLHQNTVSIERKTLARVLRNGKEAFKNFFQKIRLQEACFEDVIVIYRKAEVKTEPSELDIISDEDMDLKRNLVIRHYSDIPLADMEMVLPEKFIFLPPTVFVQLVITTIMGIVAIVSTFVTSDKVTGGILYSSLVLLGTRAYQIYNSALMRKTAIEKQMSKILFEHSTAAQEKVVSALVDEMIKQHTRELLICYALLVAADEPISAEELDERCEDYLAKELNLKIDFTCEVAVPILVEWHLIEESEDGRLSPTPLEPALKILDAIWDNLFDFKGQGVGKQSSAGLVGVTRKLLGKPKGATAAEKAYAQVAAAPDVPEENEDRPSPRNLLIPENPSEEQTSKGGIFHRIKKKVSHS